MAGVDEQIRGQAQFERDLSRFLRDVDDKHAVTIVRRISIEVLARVIRKTPVDIGEARGQWQLGVGGENKSTAPASKGVGEPLARGRRALAGLRPFVAVFISNGAAHIMILENGGFVPADPGPSKDKRRGRKGRVLVQGGYSVQAPAGMIAVTLAEVRAMFP